MLVHGAENEAKRLMEKLKMTFPNLRVDAPPNRKELNYDFDSKKEFQVDFLTFIKDSLN